MNDLTTKGTLPISVDEPCVVCNATPAPHKCGGCESRRYCGPVCQKVDWKDGGHKALCASLDDTEARRRKVHIVVTVRGEGQTAAFFSRKKADKCAVKTQGDVRYPMGSETYAPRGAEPGAPGADAFAALRAAVSGEPAPTPNRPPITNSSGTSLSAMNVMCVDHPMYHRPVSATEHFYVNGKPSSVYVVECGDRGCRAFVASVHADEGEAEAEAAKRDADDEEGMSWWVAECVVGAYSKVR